MLVGGRLASVTGCKSRLASRPVGVGSGAGGVSSSENAVSGGAEALGVMVEEVPVLVLLDLRLEALFVGIV